MRLIVPISLELYFSDTTGLVLNNICLESAKCDSSMASEHEAFKIAIAGAHERFGDHLKVVCTDGHMGIAACMRISMESGTHWTCGTLSRR